MEACTLMTVKIPKYVNELKFTGCNLNPVVVLTDCTKVKKSPTASPDPPPKPSEAEESVTPKEKSSQLTPQKYRPHKKKRISQAEYEIERIVGYHRNKQGKMWYLIKWKGWGEEHNTFELIDNLTRCHLELMKYFETQRPTSAMVRQKNLEVMKAARKTEFYGKLRRNECRGVDIKTFLSTFPREFTRSLFQTKDPKPLCKRAEEEYEYMIRCLIGMGYHEDPGLFERARNYKLLIMLIQQRRKQLANLAAAEKLINTIEKTEVGVVNEEDLEEFPDLDYMMEMRPGKGVFLSQEPVLGCECEECKPKSHCCGKMADSVFAYTLEGKLRTSNIVAIYECNRRCRCPPSCPNRVVQRGRKVKLTIFKTKNCGWGVRAAETIPKGAFVCEYVGELISDSEANARDLEYLRDRKSGYMFDLDFFTDNSVDMYCIDATEQGNLARFINHSCDPNLVVYPVWVDCLAPNIHRLAFFARRRIREGEEIHFDYENLQELPEEEEEEELSGDNGKGYTLRMISNVRCHCNSANCRSWVFGSK